MYSKRNLSKVLAKAQLSQNEIEHYVDMLDQAIKSLLTKTEPVVMPGLGVFTPEGYAEKKDVQLKPQGIIKKSTLKTSAFIPICVRNSVH